MMKCFMFPGQGSQMPGMTSWIRETFPPTNDYLSIASKRIGIDLISHIVANDPARLRDSEIAQPAILATSYSLYRYSTDVLGLQPSLLAGHSLGEYGALVAAGILDFADAIELVHLRGKIMSDIGKKIPGTMYGIYGLSHNTLQAVIDRQLSTPDATQGVVISNYNSPMEHVISGPEHEVVKVANAVRTLRGKPIRLDVAAAFHHPMMKPLADQFAAELDRYTIRPPHTPVLSPTTGGYLHTVADVRSALTQQFSQPVQWRQIMTEVLSQDRAMVFIDVGPKSILSKLLKDTYEGLGAFHRGTMQSHSLYSAVGRAGLTDYIRQEQTEFLEHLLLQMAISKNCSRQSSQHTKAMTTLYRQCIGLITKLESGPPLASEDLSAVSRCLDTALQWKKSASDDE